MCFFLLLVGPPTTSKNTLPTPNATVIFSMPGTPKNQSMNFHERSELAGDPRWQLLRMAMHVPFKSLVTIFYRLVFHPPFYIIRVWFIIIQKKLTCFNCWLTSGVLAVLWFCELTRDFEYFQGFLLACTLSPGGNLFWQVIIILFLDKRHAEQNYIRTYLNKGLLTPVVNGLYT